MSRFSLRMRDVVDQTGIGEATLRAWERRYGFPAPQRLPSGHRRYDADDVQRLRHAARLRAAGISAATAIERARELGDRPPESVFGTLRRMRPEMPVDRLPKRSLVALSHAIEDECTYGATGIALFGAFQRARHYRASEPRWRELSGASVSALVFADFPRLRRPRGGPVEVPIRARHPLAREWVVICDGDDRAACLVAWEPPGQSPASEGERVYDTLWTTDREVVRAGARICCSLAAASASPEVAAAADLLDHPVSPPSDEVARTESLTRRMIAYLAHAA